MDSSERPKKEKGAGEGETRLPYEPPRIVYRESLEVIAALCSDLDSKQDGIVCNGTPQS